MDEGTIFFTILVILIVIYTVIELAYEVKQYVNKDRQRSELTDE